MENFRFKDLDIWLEGMNVSDLLFDIADLADTKRLYKFAEQLRSAVMSYTNNIAEGSGSYSKKDFASFLYISRRSTFECANILHIMERRKVIDQIKRLEINPKLISLSKKIYFFRQTLLGN